MWKNVIYCGHNIDNEYWYKTNPSIYPGDKLRITNNKIKTYEGYAKDTYSIIDKKHVILVNSNGTEQYIHVEDIGTTVEVFVQKKICNHDTLPALNYGAFFGFHCNKYIQL
mgnify:CR=1 FL=1